MNFDEYANEMGGSMILQFFWTWGRTLVIWSTTFAVILVALSVAGR